MGRHLARRPRRRLLRVLLTIAVVAELGAGISLALERTGEAAPFAGATPSASASTDPDVARRLAEFHRVRDARAAAIRSLLDRRAAAVLRRDKAAWLATIDPSSPAFRQKQGAYFDALAQVPIGSWVYDLDADRELTGDPAYVGHYRAETFVPEVRLRYALRGFDPEPTVIAQQLTFVKRAAGWFLGNDADFDETEILETGRELWDFGPVTVVARANVLVLGRGARRRLLEQVADTAAASIPRVSAVWGTDWTRKVVVLVPESQAELGSIIDENDDLSRIAAVAVAQLGGSSGNYRAVGNRIIVNPPNFSRLSSLGKRVILQHEITHVATRDASSAATPTWLNEGIADYLGYLGTGVSIRSAARELGAEIRSGKVPASLPSDEDFNVRSARLSQAYEASWLACRLIVERTSEASLVAFYRALGRLSGGATDAEIARVWQSVLKTTPDSFTKAWQAYLRQQLG